jgi:hypothetical protein
MFLLYLLYRPVIIRVMREALPASLATGPRQ